MEVGEWLRSQLIEQGVGIRDRGANTSKDFFNICCPFCHESKFHFGINRFLGWGHCFVCGKGGKFEKIYRALRQTINLPKPPEKIVFIDEGEDGRLNLYKNKFQIKSLVLDNSKWTREIVEYVRDKRQLDINRAIEFGLCRGVQTFNDGKQDNYLRDYACFSLPEGGLVCRRIPDKSTLPRWKSFLDKDDTKITLMGSSLVYKYRPKKVFVVEGMFDLLRFPLGTAIAIGGSNFNAEKTEALLSVIDGFMPEVVVFLDRDVNFDKLNNFKMTLESFGVKCSIFPWNIIDAEIGDIDEFCVRNGEDALWELCEVISPSSLDFADNF